MFIETFFELLALLGSIIAVGAIMVAVIIVLYIVVCFLKNFVKLLKEDSKPEDK